MDEPRLFYMSAGLPLSGKDRRFIRAGDPDRRQERASTADFHTPLHI